MGGYIALPPPFMSSSLDRDKFTFPIILGKNCVDRLAFVIESLFSVTEAAIF